MLRGIRSVMATTAGVAGFLPLRLFSQLAGVAAGAADIVTAEHPRVEYAAKYCRANLTAVAASDGACLVLACHQVVLLYSAGAVAGVAPGLPVRQRAGRAARVPAAAAARRRGPTPGQPPGY